MLVVGWGSRGGNFEYLDINCLRLFVIDLY